MDYPKVKVCLDTSEDNLIDELYTPCLKWAERFDRGVGYFTTGWLTYNVAGLSDFASRGGKMRLITSPILSTEDTDAIIGAENQDCSAFLRLEAALLENVEILKQEIEADIINTFSWMLYDGIIDMRFAIPCEKLFTQLALVNKTAVNKLEEFESLISQRPELLQKCIIFVQTMEYGAKLQEILVRYSDKYHTYYADDEKINLENFAAGKIDCLLTCKKVSEGIDISSVTNIILFSSDRSRLVTTQRIGRALRLDKNNPEKKATVDDRQYKYFLSMNYKDGTVQVETSAPPKGREAGLRLPESIRGIFTPEFVRRFVFDGEQAAKSMDSSSNEADETIRYLYRLDELDEILAANQRILTEIQNAEGKRGTSSSLSNLRTRQSDIDAIRAKLRARCEKLREEIAAFEAEKVEKEKQRQELDKSYEKLNQEKNDILKEQQKNRGEIDVKITSILGIIKSPYLLSESLCARMFELGNSMKKLKLPKTIAKDFFTELASADRCVCDRCIGERERTAILKRADQYLGSDQQSVLNAVKSSLMDSVYDERLKKAFEELEELRAQANRLDTRFKTNEEKLIKAGGEKARELQERIEELIRLISIARDELERIESKDENDASLTEENNLHKADQKFKYYEQEIAKATRTNTALRKKELVDSLVNEIKLQATTALKQEIVRKTNEKPAIATRHLKS